MERVKVTIYTDPGCPFGFNAQGQETQLSWHYGEGLEATRSPMPEARALAHRLSRSNGGLRYSTGSAVFERGDRRVVMPGFQSFAVYEVAVANVAPDLDRRPPPQTAEEVVSWAPYPLATAEVAELRGVTLDQARAELRQANAIFVPAADDGYWSEG